MGNRALPDNAEALIAQFIRFNFVALRRYLDRPTIKSMVLMLIQSMVAGNFLLSTILNFKCSNHFLTAFLRRYDFSFLGARTAKRLKIDDEECTVLMIALRKVIQDFPEANIVNFDESKWQLVLASE
jgi:hypothetical protein